jgi:hypothetical protein
MHSHEIQYNYNNYEQSYFNFVAREEKICDFLTFSLKSWMWEMWDGMWKKYGENSRMWNFSHNMGMSGIPWYNAS